MKKVIAWFMAVSFVVMVLPMNVFAYTSRPIYDESIIIKSVSLGTVHTLAVDKNGNLFAWGDNEYAGSIVGGNSPRYIMDNVKTAYAYYFNNFIIKNDGSLYAQGFNDYGQVGNGDGGTVDGYIKYQKNPVKILDNVEKVASNGESIAAILTDGTLWTWGRNDLGQLGIGSKKDSYKPVKIMNNIVDVSIGADFMVALNKDGNVYTWGNNDKGQLGDGTTKASLKPKFVVSKMKAISAGIDHTLALGINDKLCSWGANDVGQAGQSKSDKITKPLYILKDVSEFVADAGFSMALTKSGNLYTWGWNGYGSLGTGEFKNEIKPLKIMGNIEKITAFDAACAAIDKDGKLYTWGNNMFQQTGTGYKNADAIALPTYILDECEEIIMGSVTSFAMLKYNGCCQWGGIALKEDGTEEYFNCVSGWHSYYPRIIKKQRYTFDGDIGFKKVLACYAGVLAIDELDRLWSWGPNSVINPDDDMAIGAGKLGNGFESNNGRAKIILEDVKDVVSGLNTTLILTNKNELYICGNYSIENEAGFINALVPTKIAEKVKKIYTVDNTKYKSRCAVILEDDSLWMWGNIHFDNGFKNFGFTKIADNVEEYCGKYDTEAYITKKGHLYVWGRVPMFDVKSENEPVLVATNVKQAEIDEKHIAIIKNDDSLWVCGKNDFGMLGIEQSDTNGEFIKAYENVKDVRMCRDFTCVLTYDSDLLVAGYNKEKRFIVDDRVENINSFTKIFGDVKEMHLFDGADVDDKAERYFVLIAIKNNGEMYGMGDNTNGKIMSGNIYDTIKMFVHIGNDVDCVSCCYTDLYVINSNNELWARGIKDNNMMLGKFEKGEYGMVLISRSKNLSLADLDGNGNIEANDATLILRYVAKLDKFTQSQKTAGDVNNDGDIDSSDATKILRIVAQLDNL